MQLFSWRARPHHRPAAVGLHLTATKREVGSTDERASLPGSKAKGPNGLDHLLSKQFFSLPKLHPDNIANTHYLAVAEITARASRDWAKKVAAPYHHNRKELSDAFPRIMGATDLNLSSKGEFLWCHHYGSQVSPLAFGCLLVLTPFRFLSRSSDSRRRKRVPQRVHCHR